MNGTSEEKRLRKKYYNLKTKTDVAKREWDKVKRADSNLDIWV